MDYIDTWNLIVTLACTCRSYNCPSKCDIF